MQGIVRGLECVIDKFYACRNGVFGVCGAAFLIVIIYGMVSLKEKRRYVINKLLHKALYVIGIVCIGECLSLSGLALQIEYRYFNAMLFIGAVGFVLLYGIIQGVVFLKIKEPMLQLCRYVRYILFFELFLLAVTQRLELAEGIVGMAAVVCMEILFLLSEKRRKEQEKKEEEHTKESDYSNKDLLDTRKRQLERFIPILKQQKDEPYAVMISGEWGVGKSSFVKALEDRMPEDCFVWVKAGSEKTVSEIMLEISEQILKILRENNVFIESEGFIERYFLAFSGLLDEAGLGFWGKISHMLGADGGKGARSQSYINGKLKNLDKTIYLIIDDLDRCDEDYQLKMFRVIRESTALTNCKTIFLVDKAMFLTESCNVGYIEKYVNYTLDLCTVKYEEIADYFIRDIFNDEVVEGINEVLLDGRSGEAVRNLIGQFPANILEILKDEAEKTARNGRGKTENERAKELRQNKLKDIEETISEIQKNITNSRKVKNYFKGVKRSLVKLSDGIEQCSPEYLKEDWISPVVGVEFIKYILPERFQDIQACTDIYAFFKKDTEYTLQRISGVGASDVLYSDKKKEILNYIIYRLDIIDFSEIKTQKEKYLNELRGENAQFHHINDYVQYAESYGDYEEILKVYGARKDKSETDRETFIRTIMKSLSDISLFPRADAQEFLELSKRLTDALMKSGLTEGQKGICVSEGEKIVRKALLNNARDFKDVLYFFFKTERLERAWQKLDVMDVDKFYKMLLMLDQRQRFAGLHSGTNNLLNIEAYYHSIENELKKAEYEASGVDFEEKFRSIRLALEICKFWKGVEGMLNEAADTADNTLPLFERYFTLNGAYSFTQETFADIDSLEKALEVLGVFLEKKAEHYDSRFSRILLRVVYQLVLLYDENTYWFQSGGMGIEELLEKIDKLVETVYRLDVSEDRDDKEVIDEIKIFVYRLHFLYREKQGKAQGEIL